MSEEQETESVKNKKPKTVPTGTMALASAEKDTQGFVSITKPRMARATFPSNPLPQLSLRKTILSFTDEVWQELGAPEWVEVFAHPQKKLLKIQGRENLGERRYMTGFRKVLPLQYGDGEKYYTLKLSESSGRKNVMEALPKGYYVPIGGRVYRYHGPSPAQR
jgi:hypothetical protein